MFETYTVDDVIAKARTNIVNFKQRTGMGNIRYSKVLREISFQSGCTDDQPKLKGTLCEGLHESSFYLMRTDWGAK